MLIPANVFAAPYGNDTTLPKNNSELTKAELVGKVDSLEEKVKRLEELLFLMEDQIKQNVYLNINKNLNQIEKRIGSLEDGDSEKEIVKKVNKNLDKKIEETVEAKVIENFAMLEPAAGEEENEVKITMSPTPKLETADGKFSFQPFGLLHLDTAFFSDDKVDHPDGAEFRRARIGAKGKYENDFNYILELDFANEGTNFRNTYVEYTGIENWNLKVGNTKAPFSFSDLVAPNDTTFIERAAPTTAFNSGYEISLFAGTRGENWTFAASIQNDDAGTQSSDDEAWKLNARATATPWVEKDSLVHIGAAARFVVPDSASEVIRYGITAENGVQSVNSIDTGASGITNADNATLFNLELASIIDSFSLQSEYTKSRVNRGDAASLDFSGWYAQVAYLLTGESRPYDSKNGVFGHITPNQSFNIEKGTWGAWEVASRYSNVDLNDKDITGGEMSNYTAALNWYLNNNTKLMANYIKVDTDQNAPTANDDPSIFLLRGALDF